MSAWGSITTPPATVNLAEIMSEEYAHRVHDNEVKRYEKKMAQAQKESMLDNVASGSRSNNCVPVTPALSYSQAVAPALPNKEVARPETDDNEWEDCSHLLTADTTATNSSPEPEEWENYSTLIELEAGTAAKQGKTLPPEVLELFQKANETDNDELIAALMQSQFDHAYNEDLRRYEHKMNKDSKITVKLDKWLRHGDEEFLDKPNSDDEEEEDELTRQKRDWDRFDTNEKLLDAIPKCGYRVDKEGEMITKHDENLCGVRNACRIMSFPPEFPTGDSAGFDMKLSNKVFNNLKTYSRRNIGKKNRQSDRKVNNATAEMGMDAPTRLLLYKLINGLILESINGIISTGKEAVILHANSDPAYSGGNDNSHHKSGGNVAFMQPHMVPKECAIKIFRTTLNEFKQRDRYIKDDYRFKERFNNQNKRVVINLWAQKEMQNLMRLQSVGIPCPDVVILKKHVLVMSFIGENSKAAPKLKDVQFSMTELSLVYEEIIAAMFRFYHEANLVHADLSEYNILWHEGKCWFIDVAQSVEPEHPGAMEFLMRDCGNIIKFFTKRGLSDIFTQEQLFAHITGHNAEKHNVALLERMHTRGPTIKQATAPNQEDCPDVLKPLTYPFDLAWAMSQEERQISKDMQALNIQENDSSNTTTSLAAANTAKH